RRKPRANSISLRVASSSSCACSCSPSSRIALANRSNSPAASTASASAGSGKAGIAVGTVAPFLALRPSDRDSAPARGPAQTYNAGRMVGAIDHAPIFPHGVAVLKMGTSTRTALPGRRSGRTRSPAACPCEARQNESFCGEPWPVLSPAGSATLGERLKPREQIRLAVAPVTAKRDVRHVAGARLLAHPAGRHVEELGSLLRGEQPIGHAAPAFCRRSASNA